MNHIAGQQPSNHKHACSYTPTQNTHTVHINTKYPKTHFPHTVCIKENKREREWASNANHHFYISLAIITNM